jgi:hypothetical protein
MLVSRVNCTWASGFVVLIAATGCTDSPAGGNIEFGEASGVVTYQGAPLSGARVMAMPEKGPLATGTTDADGKFTLSSGANKGVAVGKVRVAVSIPEASSDASPPPVMTDPTAATAMMRAQADKAKEKPAEKPASLLPEKYADVNTSGLSFEIKSGKNDLPIDLK